MRRTKFALHILASNTVSKNPIPHSLINKTPGYGNSHLSPSSTNLGFNFRAQHNRYNPFYVTTRRYYYVDRNFQRRGTPELWYKNPKYIMIATIVGSGVLITINFGSLETIPYTKRTHFILLSKNLEKQMGETQFQEMKAAFKGKILPSIHPESVRIRLISKDIIGALERGLSKEEVWSDPGLEVGERSGIETLKALSESGEKIVDDDEWVYKSRKKGGLKSESGHLEGLNWEVLVVNEPVVNAFCLPGGKIVVFTGLLQHFRSDAEIATIIGHEVGHVVARHAAEGITKNLWVAIIQFILYQFIMPDLANTMSTFLLRLPFSRRMEIEADHIGVLLMASAGYDPRVAPTVFEKLGKVTGGDSPLRDYLSTHPSGKKRAKLLWQAKVMEEALLIYKEARAGRGIEGFL